MKICETNVKDEIKYAEIFGDAKPDSILMFGNSPDNPEKVLPGKKMYAAWAMEIHLFGNRNRYETLYAIYDEYENEFSILSYEKEAVVAAKAKMDRSRFRSERVVRRILPRNSKWLFAPVVPFKRGGVFGILNFDKKENGKVRVRSFTETAETLGAALSLYNVEYGTGAIRYTKKGKNPVVLYGKPGMRKFEDTVAMLLSADSLMVITSGPNDMGTIEKIDPHTMRTVDRFRMKIPFPEELTSVSFVSFVEDEKKIIFSIGAGKRATFSPTGFCFVDKNTGYAEVLTTNAKDPDKKYVMGYYRNEAVVFEARAPDTGRRRENGYALRCDAIYEDAEERKKIDPKRKIFLPDFGYGEKPVLAVIEDGSLVNSRSGEVILRDISDKILHRAGMGGARFLLGTKNGLYIADLDTFEKRPVSGITETPTEITDLSPIDGIATSSVATEYDGETNGENHGEEWVRFPHVFGFPSKTKAAYLYMRKNEGGIGSAVVLPENYMADPTIFSIPFVPFAKGNEIFFMDFAKDADGTMHAMLASTKENGKTEFIESSNTGIAIEDFAVKSGVGAIAIGSAGARDGKSFEEIVSVNLSKKSIVRLRMKTKRRDAVPIRLSDEVFVVLYEENGEPKMEIFESGTWRSVDPRKYGLDAKIPDVSKLSSLSTEITQMAREAADALKKEDDSFRSERIPMSE